MSDKRSTIIYLKYRLGSFAFALINTNLSASVRSLIAYQRSFITKVFEKVIFHIYYTTTVA